MNKLTRRLKKKRKNKTFKGGSDTEASRPINVEPLKEGVQAVGNVIESVNNTVGDGVGWVKDTASKAFVGTTNFFADKANDLGTSLIGSIANKVQANMPVNISEQGVDILEKKSEKLIEAEAAITRKVLDETTEIMKEKLPDIADAAGTAAAAAFETIPFVGAFAAAGTFLNKGIEASEKTLDMFDQIQDITKESLAGIDETIKQVNAVGIVPNLPDVGAISPPDVGAISPPDARGGGFKNLTKQKAQIGGRISESISEFSNPIGYQLSILKGGNNNKTKRLVKRNKKSRSRRVHFSL